MNLQISYQDAQAIIRPQDKQHDVISGTISTSGGTDSQIFKPNNYPILIYRTGFTMYDRTSGGVSRAIIETDSARDKFTATMYLTNKMITFAPIDTFLWNDMNTDNVNGFYWLILPQDRLQVDITHEVVGSTAANNVPIKWQFAMQYYILPVNSLSIT